MSEKPKVGALSHDPVLHKDAVYEIAHLVARPGEEPRKAENRVRTRIRDARCRTKRLRSVFGPSGWASPRAEFCQWAEEAFGMAVRKLPGFARSYVIPVGVGKIAITGFPPTVMVANLEDFDWLREHYPRVVTVKQALELEVSQLRRRVAELEAENEAFRSKKMRQREEGKKHGSKGGRGNER